MVVGYVVATGAEFEPHSGSSQRTTTGMVSNSFWPHLFGIIFRQLSDEVLDGRATNSVENSLSLGPSNPTWTAKNSRSQIYPKIKGGKVSNSLFKKM